MFLLKILWRLKFVFRIYFSTNQCLIILNLPFQVIRSSLDWPFSVCNSQWEYLELVTWNSFNEKLGYLPFWNTRYTHAAAAPHMCVFSFYCIFFFLYIISSLKYETYGCCFYTNREALVKPCMQQLVELSSFLYSPFVEPNVLLVSVKHKYGCLLYQALLMSWTFKILTKM